MRNLWIFISKYNAFFFFAIFFIISVILLVRNNSYQHASALNSSNRITGEAYERINHFKSYLALGRVNDSLVAENSSLRNQLSNARYTDTVKQNTVKDTLTRQQYTYIVAKVVNNSVNQKNNYITINRGSRQGVAKGMGVICANGVVGQVLNVSENFATVLSLLHSDTHISAGIAGTGAFGSLVWGIGNYDPRIAILQDIPNHVMVKPGAKVVTTTYSATFPAGHPIGTVIQTNKKGGASFLDIEVRLSTDFSRLEYVYVVNNLMAAEQLKLEAQSKKDE